ncbi:MAG: hypothetical protein GQ552_08855, partial [Flavobacteriaceae bacterium]|nr:hypothetical protein [Flavobacteriaceae bacterium]
MKELERTKRISISAVLFLLVILIAVLTFKKPEYIFEKDSATTLDKMATKDYILSQNDLKKMDASKYTIIDIRSNYEYAKGHITDAVNISPHEVFNESTIDFLNQLRDSDKTAILYGEHPDNANNGWMLLYQLGYENIKVLCIETVFVDNEFQTKNVDLEKPAVNFAQVMQDAMEDKKETKVEVTKAKKPKKVIPLPKKKKRVPEGGC